MSEPTSDIKANINEYERFYGAQDFNPGTKDVKLPVEIKHAYFNHHFIFHDIKEGSGADLQTVNVHENVPALILGSGPTLDLMMPHLKDWKGAIFASTSQTPTCCYYGHAPEYIVALDPHTNLTELECVDDWKKYPNSKLITHPSISPTLVQGWQGDRLYYRPMEPSSEFHAMHLPVAYGEVIQTYCLLFSCSPSAQVALARKMGYHPLYLAGLDFGFPDYQRRATQYYYHELEGWICDKPVAVDKDDTNFKSDNPYRRLIYSDNGCCSSVMHIYYKRAFLCVANIDMSEIFKVKAFNALTEFPEITVEELIETQGKLPKDRYWPKEKKQKIYEDYLARFYTFALRYKDNSLTYFECTPTIEKHADKLPPDMQKVIADGGKITIDEQIKRFVTNNFNTLKAQAAQVKQRTGKDAEQLLDPIKEIKRLQELNHEAERYRNNFVNRK